MKLKWYYQTWFIALCFAAWMLVAPAIIGLVLLVKQYNLLRENSKLFEDYKSKIDDYEKETGSLFKEKCDLESQLSKCNDEITSKKDDAEKLLKTYDESLKKIKADIAELTKERSLLESESLVSQYSFSDYDSITSEECKNKLAILKQKEQSLINESKVLAINSSGSNKEINANKKQIIRCFNAECDNTMVNISVKNIDSLRNRTVKSFESLNKIFEIDGVQMSRQLLEIKLEELNLVYTYELKKQQEKELQKAIKEQMIEEEKLRREIENRKKQIEKDQIQVSSEVKKLMSYLQKTQNDVEKQMYIDKINELENKLKQLELDKKEAEEREMNAKAGFVYVISNIGSFGENIFKIGMTRRLEPMDRIKELSSASVPFEFDVHAMIFSDNAPELESILHNHFRSYSVNKVNYKKEFFNVSIDEIEAIVKENFNNTVEFTKIPVAKEYRESLELAKLA